LLVGSGGSFHSMGKASDFLYLAIFIVICAWGNILGATSLPSIERYSGKLQQYQVKDGESLIEIARKFDLGYNSIVDANPGVDPFVPKNGTLLTIPTARILPEVATRPAIVINIPEFRLYYFPKKTTSKVLTFPLGIGDQGTDTPTGNYTVIEKLVHPVWYVPKSIRQSSGLPRIVPPGPENPLGSHALRLSLPSILIHGTNRPWGIGRRSSHGCLRLYPEDIVLLYKLVPKGIKVVIVKQPIKICTRGKQVMIEVHRYVPLELSVGLAMQMLADRNLLGRTDFARLIRAVEEGTGVAVDVTLTVGKAHAP
jgi:L,D-transpeptidase ErfK/SrfK